MFGFKKDIMARRRKCYDVINNVATLY